MANTILITGAASGIGEAAVSLFFEKGWDIVALDISREGLKKIGDRCLLTIPCDVSDIKEVESAYNLLKKNNVRLDGIFNSAGILRMGLFKSIDLKEQLLEIDVNIKGIVSIIYKFLPLMEKGSSIVNMSSLAGLYGTPELVVYSATKSAVKTLTEGLNIEFEKDGIFVCDILVDYVKTPMVLDAKYKATSVKRLGVTVSPEKVAKTVYKAVIKKNRVHHYVGIKSKALNILSKLFPFATRFLTKVIAFK